MLNFVNKYLFNKCMKRVQSNMTLAWRTIKISDNCESDRNQKNSTHFFNQASKYLLEAHKELCFAASTIPKNDPLAEYQIVEVILKLDNPIKYYSNYYGLEFMFKFKTKTIENKWKEQSQMFTNNSKDLIEYEKIIEKMSLE